MGACCWELDEEQSPCRLRLAVRLRAGPLPVKRSAEAVGTPNDLLDLFGRLALVKQIAGEFDFSLVPPIFLPRADDEHRKDKDDHRHTAHHG